jgi:hypothetical protein
VLARLDKRRLISAAFAAAGLVLIALAFVTADTGGDRVRITKQEVAAVFPGPQDLVLRQSQVGASLVPGFTGTLQINGNEVSPDELSIDVNANLSTIVFQPGPGKSVEELRTGTNTVTVVFWNAAAGRGAGADSFTWTFNVS